MGLILFAVFLGIAGELLWFKFCRESKKQFIKYDKEHSDVTVLGEDDVVSKLSKISNLGIQNIKAEANRVDFACKKDNYAINIENGVAYVEYDMSGFEVKLSTIGKMKKKFKFWKSARKAMLVNAIMDAFKNNGVCDRGEYQKTKIYAKASVVAFVAFLIFLIAGFSSFAGFKYDAAIEDAKTMTYYNNVTYGELIDKYVREAEWTAFNSENDVAVVEVNGTSVEGEQICIQFCGELGMGLSYRTLTLEYFEVNGVSMDTNWMMEYVYLNYYLGGQIEDPSDNNHGENNSTIINSWLSGQKVYGMESTNFSNGMAVISSIDGDKKTLYGIDKKGNWVFTLENHSTLYEKKQFTNGLLYIYNWETDTISLMDETGKIITAEELGGTQFVSFDNQVYGRAYWGDMFEDGYIIVNKVVTTFQGTTYESAIFDKNLNVVVDYSEKLYPVIYDSYANSTYEGQMYILGHLVWEECEDGNVIHYAWDFQSNEIKEYNENELENFFNELIETMDIEDLLKYGFIEEKDYTQTPDLSAIIGLDQYPTINRVMYINECLYLAVFSEGYGDVFFTITNETGVFRFEPIKYSAYNFSGEGTGQGSQIYATDKYVVTLDTIEKTHDEDHMPVLTYKITTYDIDGNMINSINHIHSGGIYPEKFYVDVNNEAIVFANVKKVTYYDFNLNVLCEN